MMDTGEDDFDPLDGLDLAELTALALTTRELVEALFPGRLCITPEELAHAWKGKATRGVVQRIRGKLKDGTLIPGLQRNGGRWDIPVPSVATILEEMTRVAERSREPRVISNMGTQLRTKRRRKTNIGPRPRLIGFAIEAWSAVYDALDVLWAQESRQELLIGLERTGAIRGQRDL